MTGTQASCGANDGEAVCARAKPIRAKFEPYKGKKCKPGTGYVKQLSANCWQGRYTPTVDGKRLARNVYADIAEECEGKLAELIREMKTEYGIK